MARSSWRLAGTVFGLLAGCAVSGCAALPQLPAPERLAASAPPSLPPAPPLVRSGEEMRWRVRVGPFAAGSMRVSAAALQWLRGRRVAVVRGWFSTSGLAAMFDDKASEDTTWVDLGTARPLHYRSTLSGDDGRSSLEARFEPRSVRVVETRKPGGRRVVHQRVPDGGGALNLYAALLAIRSWHEPRAASLSVWARSRLWRVALRRGRIESVETAMGRVRAWRIDGVAWRTRRDGSPDPEARPRRFRVYLGADRDRLPVLIETDSRLGRVRAEMVDYHRSSRSAMSSRASSR